MPRIGSSLGSGASRCLAFVSAPADESLASVIASAIFDLDSRLAASYSGLGQTWANLVPSPADGLLQSAYDFNLGANSGADTSDPTFNGTAGDAGAYWTSDGFDSFTIPANTTFLNNLSKAATTDWWLCAQLFLPTGTGGSYLFGTRGGSPERGLQIRTSPLRLQIAQYQGGSAVSATGSAATALTANANNVIVVSRRASDGQIKFWTNSGTVKDTQTLSYAAGTDNPTQLARLNYITDALTARLYHLSMGNEYLDDTKAGAIIAHVQARGAGS